MELFGQPIKKITHEIKNLRYYSSGYHKPTNTKVAIKKVSTIFSNLENTKRLLREVKLLRHFNNENVGTSKTDF